MFVRAFAALPCATIAAFAARSAEARSRLASLGSPRPPFGPASLDDVVAPAAVVTTRLGSERRLCSAMEQAIAANAVPILRRPRDQLHQLRYELRRHAEFRPCPNLSPYPMPWVHASSGFETPGGRGQTAGIERRGESRGPVYRH